ncbi:ATP-binding cassette domain-containing protein [Lactiplantibacillus mudanjiangensis]|uniref:Multidrug ABC transporter [Lactobacillus sp.] n=1 Tax=Lactiplantibacillus mudanjiangensis TaxID=1296538 RepID=A0A660E1D9_9LACO|nr:ABC transporter ATP-binding protein [Lactiplantibacillus mudanjiangensis]VDG21080.1 multidrug ABC transporter [Lactobacillus sp.] [Lactiplantibacillus mudanjiangensis]VDG22987.1 multidrug ABC transporter [Lactobacillus sp.] [Lactiplantibacillus mudanjiangensis]VDG29155.1 multidrug ABC transporter [Lactobacillus sp.] [Lactiplantibacillus mudanjiangensis]VDG31675.1 multidrug ABC transporter [Lactobacillus sp.] [Lactiplantibacillus mudanjiangensis]
MSLKITNLNKQIDHHATLIDLDFTVEPGQIVGIIGRNGVGKTTLFRTINGQYLPDTGQVLVDDQAVSAQPELRQRLSFVDPQANFFKGVTAKQIAWYYRATYPEFDQAKFDQLMTRYQLPVDQKLRHFSKGMFGLFTIILSVSTKATYLFLDEPLDGLDVIIRKNVLNILIDEVANGDHAILIASHNLSELEGIIDRVLMLKDGRIKHDYQLETMRAQARKMQVVYRDKTIPAVLREQGHIISVSGRVIVVVFENFTPALADQLTATKPVFQEALPLSLTDLFVANLTDEHDYELLS